MVYSTLSTLAALGAALALVGLVSGCRSRPPVMGLNLADYRQALDASAGVAAPIPGSDVEKQALQRFSDFYAVYSTDAIRSGVRKVYAEDAWFGDPFHGVKGIDAIEHYFLVMAEPVESCTFSIDGMQRCDDDFYIRWTMKLVSSVAKHAPIEAIGMSHVRFNPEGLIDFQQDYWDTSVMLDRLPVVGYWTRLVKKRLEKGLEK